MGTFDVTRFTVEGKPHDLVVNPAGVCSADKTRTLAGHLTKLAETQGRIFGGLPYKKFAYVYFFRPAEASAGVLEHQNSFVALWNPDALPQPDDMVGQASHEFFHLWNVKRIRPVQMSPYDYARENETPLLWVSEGFTSYYASLTLYRAGLKDARSSSATSRRSGKSRTTRHGATYPRRTPPRPRGSAMPVRLRSQFPITHRGGTSQCSLTSLFVTTPRAQRDWTRSCGRGSRTFTNAAADSAPTI